MQPTQELQLLLVMRRKTTSGRNTAGVAARGRGDGVSAGVRGGSAQASGDVGEKERESYRMPRDKKER
jgi:hypothetical protein